MIGDIDSIERVQRLPGLRNVSYVERLQILNLETLELRRIMFDVTLMFKLVHKLVDIETEDMFTFCHNNTRGPRLKINHLGARLNCRKYSFINRTIPVWNALPQSCVESSNISNFKLSLQLHTNILSMYCRGRAHTAA